MANLLIAVEITPLEADVFRKMRETGVFDLKGGNATLHFDPQGRLKSIEKKLLTFFVDK